MGDEVDRVHAAIQEWAADHGGPLVVAIDGHGAAGKSTLAERLAAEHEVAVVHVDDFWRVASAAASGTPREEQPMAEYYDWQRLRTEALEPLLQGREARFTAVDPDGGANSGRTVNPSAVIVVEGVSSACSSLADLVDRTVLVNTPETVRMSRLRERIPAEAWNQDWLDAERSYLTTRPPETFDLVVSGADCR